MAFQLTPKKRLTATICISFAFFVAEIAVAFSTRSMALMADAFHYMNDMIGFIVALVAIVISERSDFPQELSFGWQRARLLGAFFNGVFLLALGMSVFLQSIERFVSLQHVDNPKLVLIMGCVGFGLNVVSAVFLHEHDHSHDSAGSDEVNLQLQQQEDSSHANHHHTNNQSGDKGGAGRDLNMLGAMIHVLGDAANNIGVIIAALVIWKTHYPGRFYADPAVSIAIALMILISAIPLVKNSGTILLESAPRGVDIQDVKHDLERINGIESVHELHIWRLDQKKAIASAHVIVSDQTVSSFMEKARTVSECLHAYGIHSITLQPELSISSKTSLVNGAGSTHDGDTDGHADKDAAAGAGGESSSNAPPTKAKTLATSAMLGQLGGASSSSGANSSPNGPSDAASAIPRRRTEDSGCQIPCGTLCENLMCCK